MNSQVNRKYHRRRRWKGLRGAPDPCSRAETGCAVTAHAPTSARTASSTTSARATRASQLCKTSSMPSSKTLPRSRRRNSKLSSLKLPSSTNNLTLSCSNKLTRLMILGLFISNWYRMAPFLSSLTTGRIALNTSFTKNSAKISKQFNLILLAKPRTTFPKQPNQPPKSSFLWPQMKATLQLQLSIRSAHATKRSQTTSSGCQRVSTRRDSDSPFCTSYSIGTASTR